MGVYLNPGNDAFRMAINDDIYIDKTELIKQTNDRLGKRNRYICVSRPRRFGKSMAAEMLVAYYGKNCDSSELFAPYKIAADKGYEKNLNQYNVIVLNIQNFLSVTEYSVDTMISYLQAEVIEELRESFPGKVPENVKNLAIALDKVYSKTAESFIFVIDEWDCILRERQYTADVQKKYLDFIRNLLKDKTYVALAYMTGILPIKKYGTHSALNMFAEYSMINPRNYAEFTGFTEEEVKELCLKYNMDYEMMKSWYDGYSFSEISHIYNPKSVVDSILYHQFASYWTQTETYEALKIYIDLNYDGLKDSIVQMLGGEKIIIDYKTFQNDMTTFQNRDDVLTLLVHLGYLAYDSDCCQVSIPNAEIREEFVRTVKSCKWNDVIDALEQSDRILRATWNGDSQTVADILDAVHSENTSILTYNDENSLSCVISLAYYNAMKEYMKIREFPTGKGFADIVYLPKKRSDKPALIIELKYDKSAEGAIAQIKEKKYVESLREYHGNLLLVGINYSKESKKHTCVIEKWSI